MQICAVVTANANKHCFYIGPVLAALFMLPAPRITFSWRPARWPHLLRRAGSHRALLTTALILAVGTSLSSEAASAFTCTFGQGSASLDSCQTGFSYDVTGPLATTTNTRLNLMKLPSRGRGTISFQWIPIGSSASYAGDRWNINMAFDTPLLASSGPGQFDYMLQLDPSFSDPLGAAGWSFRDEQLAVSKINPATVVQDVFADPYFSNRISRLANPEAALANPALSGTGSAGRNQIWVRNTYQALEQQDDESGMISLIQNSFRQQQTPQLRQSRTLRSQPDQVPAPLPLAGTIAALRISRRIRKRIKAISMI